MAHATNRERNNFAGRLFPSARAKTRTRLFFFIIMFSRFYIVNLTHTHIHSVHVDISLRTICVHVNLSFGKRNRVSGTLVPPIEEIDEDHVD